MMERPLFFCDDCNKKINEMLVDVDMSSDDFINYVETNLCPKCLHEFNDYVSQCINNIENTGYLFNVINVVDENGNVVSSTDFTDESKTLEVWKLLGLEEEDFYKI